MDNRNPVTFQRTTLFPRQISLSGQVEENDREDRREEASSGRARRRKGESRFSKEGPSLRIHRTGKETGGKWKLEEEGRYGYDTMREREREKRTASKGGSLGQRRVARFPLFLCHPPSDSLPRSSSLFPRSVTLSCADLLLFHGREHMALSGSTHAHTRSRYRPSVAQITLRGVTTTVAV